MTKELLIDLIIKYGDHKLHAKLLNILTGEVLDEIKKIREGLKVLG